MLQNENAATARNKSRDDKKSPAALQKRDKDNIQSKQQYISITKIVKIYTAYELHDLVHAQIFTVTSLHVFNIYSHKLHSIYSQM
jgi:hypothetical protein